MLLKHDIELPKQTHPNRFNLDLHGGWDNSTGHNAPLYTHEFDSDKTLNVVSQWRTRIFSRINYINIQNKFFMYHKEFRFENLAAVCPSRENGFRTGYVRQIVQDQGRIRVVSSNGYMFIQTFFKLVSFSSKVCFISNQTHQYQAVELLESLLAKLASYVSIDAFFVIFDNYFNNYNLR